MNQNLIRVGQIFIHLIFYHNDGFSVQNNIGKMIIYRIFGGSFRIFVETDVAMEKLTSMLGKVSFYNRLSNKRGTTRMGKVGMPTSF